ncbi:hypothetical protein MRX96_019150 [Rhipicephalus microplus]
MSRDEEGQCPACGGHIARPHVTALLYVLPTLRMWKSGAGHYFGRRRMAKWGDRAHDRSMMAAREANTPQITARRYQSRATLDRSPARRGSDGPWCPSGSGGGTRLLRYRSPAHVIPFGARRSR